MYIQICLKTVTIKSLGFLNNHVWVINELAKDTSTTDTPKWLIIGPTLGYSMMSVYTKEPALTMPEIFVNGIRAYLHGEFAMLKLPRR